MYIWIMTLVDDMLTVLGSMAAVVFALMGICFVLWIAVLVYCSLHEAIVLRAAWRRGMKLFISGSASIKVLTPEVENVIDQFIGKGAEILVGDCYGVDSAVQRYLARREYKNVTIYTSNSTPRCDYVPGCCIISCNGETIGLHGEAFYAVKDAAMCRDCDCALMLWDGVSIGTKNNIARVKGAGKPYKVITVSGETRERMNLLKRGRAGRAQGAPA